DIRHRAAGGILALPPGREPPDAVVFRGRDHDWLLERDSGTTRPEDQSPIELGGRRFVLEIPPASHDEATEMHSGAATLATLELAFHVSRDGEHITLALTAPGLSRSVPHRAYNELLLHLARHRLRDRESGVPEASAGWIDAEQVLEDLRCDVTVNNVN